MKKGKRAQRNEAIRQYIIAQVRSHPHSLAKQVAQQFGISRQTANTHIAKLVDQGVLQPKGRGKGREYALLIETETALENSFTFDLKVHQDEDVIWRDNIKPLLADLPKNVVDLWNYAVTEMINNAIDHSGGTRLDVSVNRKPDYVWIWVKDNGVGIFNKIQRELQLPDPRQALFELKKGKLTTDKARHSGQGIFFTSRMCDDFAILSDDLIFLHNDKADNDWFTKHEKPAFEGTSVFMCIDNHTGRTAREVHDQYASDDESYQFSKTVVPIRLAAEGEALVSRSQAKRLLIRLDRFQTVILDFAGVEEVGQGFADEIFRVFAKQHPEVRLFPINTNEAVSNMITRALLTRDETWIEQ